MNDRERLIELIDNAAKIRGNANVDIYKSLRYAFEDYRYRHHGSNPAKVLMSQDAYNAILPPGIIAVCRYCMGVPLEITDEKGIHIQLCEPDIAFEKRILETIRIERDFNAE